MIAVSNSSPLVYLAKVGRLNLIRDLYGKVWIPEAVYEEVVIKGRALGIGDASMIDQAVGSWIVRTEIDPELSTRYRYLDGNERLGTGEKEALKLCKQLNADLFMVDDKEARRVARILSIKPIGTCGILINAHRENLVSASEVEEVLDRLVRAQFRIEPTLYRRILKELGVIT